MTSSLFHQSDYELSHTGIEHHSGIAMAMPTSPSQRRFYAQLLQAINAPYRPSDRLEALEFTTIRLLTAMQPRMLFVDEIHDLLSAPPAREQRAALNLLKFLSNKLNCCIVVSGTQDALVALQSDEFASRLKMPFALHTVSIIPRQARAMRIRKVKALDARIFAMAMTDNLMFASARIDDLQLRPKAGDARSMRTHWLWPLIPSTSLDLLAERIKNWPVDYVKTCWPELDHIENTPML